MTNWTNGIPDEGGYDRYGYAPDEPRRMSGPRYRVALRAAKQQCARHPGEGLEPFIPFVAQAVAEQGWLATLDYARSVRQAAKGDAVSIGRDFNR